MKQTKRMARLGKGLLMTLFWYVSSWILSLPAWVALLMHFVMGLPLYWFWATLGLWLLVGVVRWLAVCFARWGADAPAPVRHNKNPYSAGSDVFPPSDRPDGQSATTKRPFSE